MRKTIIIILLTSTTIILIKCGLIDKIYREPLKLGFIVLINDYRMLRFEKSVACYYKTNNKFPENDLVLNKYSSSIKYSENDTLLFSNLHRELTPNDALIYHFQLHPWGVSVKSDSSGSCMDSIFVYWFEGKLTFNDSLVAKNIDSLIVEIEIDSLRATIFSEEGSLHYSNLKYPNSILDQMKFFPGKISVSNSCQDFDN